MTELKTNEVKATPADTETGHRKGWRFWTTFAAFAAIALFFLWEEHQMHLLGTLPWLFLLACPLMHVFMHHGHGGHNHHGGTQKDEHDG